MSVSVFPHIPAWLPLGVFLWNIILGTFTKVCQKNSTFRQNFTQRSGTLHKDLCVFLLLVQQYRVHIALLPWQHFQHSSHCLQRHIMPKYKWNTLCHFHGKKGYANAQESYVTHTIPILFTLALEGDFVICIKSCPCTTSCTCTWHHGTRWKWMTDFILKPLSP